MKHAGLYTPLPVNQASPLWFDHIKKALGHEPNPDQMFMTRSGLMTSIKILDTEVEM